MLKRKAFAYITRGNYLLVFTHLYEPDAGIQVPLGTVESDERLSLSSYSGRICGMRCRL